MKDRHEIQKVSLLQILIVILMAGLIVLTGVLFNDYFSIMPHDLFGSTPH